METAYTSRVEHPASNTSPRDPTDLPAHHPASHGQTDFENSPSSGPGPMADKGSRCLQRCPHRQAPQTTRRIAAVRVERHAVECPNCLRYWPATAHSNPAALCLSTVERDM